MGVQILTQALLEMDLFTGWQTELSCDRNRLGADHCEKFTSIGRIGRGVLWVELSIADRATMSNMCPEYGATVAYFPIDEITIDYIRQTSK